MARLYLKTNYKILLETKKYALKLDKIKDLKRISFRSFINILDGRGDREKS